MAQSLEPLIDCLDRWSPRRIVVAGDFMLDRITYGNADRLSPDAPVPVLAHQRQEDKPGGAANVCLALLALHCQVKCLGVIGRDETGKSLRRALKKAGCLVDGLLTTDDRPTTLKHNMVGLAQHRHPQKMFRLDVESKAALPEASATKLLEAAEAALADADALCLQDHNKGVLCDPVCRALIALAERMGVPVFIDPAAMADFGRYHGATCLMPNRFEAWLTTGEQHDIDDDEQIVSMARLLRRKLALKSIVLTMDRRGLLLLEGRRRPRHVPTVARSVYDVTGAGDVVLAMFVAARVNGADGQTAAALANVAAGLEVERFGCVPIKLEEVLFALLQRQHASLGKVRTLEQLLPELAARRAQGQKVAFTNGCFDILHAGHIAYLREARKAGDLLVVGLNSDGSIRKLKGPGRPVNHEADRVMVLSELESVDYVVVFSEETPMRLIKAIKPSALVKGADYKKSEVVGADFVEAHGGKVVLVPLVEGRSTTNIITRMRSDEGEKS